MSLFLFWSWHLLISWFLQVTFFTWWIQRVFFTFRRETFEDQGISVMPTSTLELFSYTEKVFLGVGRSKEAIIMKVTSTCSDCFACLLWLNSHSKFCSESQLLIMVFWDSQRQISFLSKLVHNGWSIWWFFTFISLNVENLSEWNLRIKCLSAMSSLLHVCANHLEEHGCFKSENMSI